MLIKCKNPDLYRAWIDYLCAVEGRTHSNATIRTYAFSNSQKGLPIPLYR